MILNKYKILSLFLACFAAGSLFSSCVDDVISQPENPDNPIGSQDGYALSFKINLATMTRVGSSSDIEKYEDYIDPSSLKVLFFYGDENDTQKYNTLIRQFNSDEINLVPANNNGNSFSKEWYINIPFKESDEEFCKIVRDNKFKIAVAANWPNLSIAPGNHINKLHHQPAPSDNYQYPDQGNDKYLEQSQKAVYGFLFGETETNLGTYTNWVKSGYSATDAKKWIMTKYGPGVNSKDKYNPTDNYGQLKYNELWWRWNFNGAYNYLPENLRPKKEDNPEEVDEKKYSYDPKSDYKTIYDKDKDNDKDKEEEEEEIKDFSEAWALNNYNELHDFLYQKDNNVWKKIKHGTALEDFTAPSGYFQFKSKNTGKACLSLGNDGNGKAGIVLPEGGDKDNNVIIVKIPNNGELNIKWGSLSGPSRIELELRNHLNDNQDNEKTIEDIEISKKYNYDETNQSEKTFTSKEVKITGDAEYLFIYSTKGNAIIYEIEYISSHYLHNIDNFGKSLGNPDATHLLIPMYGIQTFDAINSLWKPGTVFDLSNFNKLGTETDNNNTPPTTTQIYTAKSISLLRSVAKVELKIPKIYKAHHIFLRSMNRKARCEPVDVSTPTDKIWEKTDVNVGPNSAHGDFCKEWDYIYGHTPFYNSVFNDKDDQGNTLYQQKEYQKKLAWYYGSWAQNTAIEENGSPVLNVNGVTIDRGNATEGVYPHIMNAMIERTDFTEFIEAGSDSYYDRYILYVPDKYVDDPGSIGDNMIKTTPKICHIEFREENDPITNIDDNWCYRIYFTDGGFYSGNGNTYPTFGKIGDTGVDQTWENSYEQKMGNLEHHWPIIRNHYYRFTVIDARNRMVVTKLEVLPWRMIEDNSYSW